MTTPYQPTIPAIVRTVVYVVGLVTGFASILVIGLGAIFYPDISTQITAAAGVVGTAMGWLSSALGVAYRPTAGHGQVEASYGTDYEGYYGDVADDDDADL